MLETAKKEVRLMSTTFFQYFNHVQDNVRDQLKKGVHFKFIIYAPSSKAIEDKAQEELCKVQDFDDEIKSTCRRWLGPLAVAYPGKCQVKFIPFNTPFGVTIVDDRQMVLSLNIYGLRRSKAQTPCLIIENKYDSDSVFKMYDDSFDSIWHNLPEDAPVTVKEYFTKSEDQKGQQTPAN